MRKHFKLFAFALVALFCTTACSEDEEKELVPEMDSSQFVLISEQIPDVILEIRYYSTYNFIGDRIPGYLEPAAILSRQAADSLKAVSDDLMKQGLPTEDIRCLPSTVCRGLLRDASERIVARI